MSFETTMDTEREMLALVGALRNDSARTVAFKLRFAKTVLGSAAAGATVTSGVVEEILFELGHSLSLRGARQILQESGLVKSSEPEGGAMQVPAAIALHDLYGEDEVAEIEISIARFLELLRLDQDKSRRSAAPAGAAECIAAVNATALWGAEIAKVVLERGLPGVPVFWDCDEGGHKPFTPDPGTLTTSDTLLLMLEGVRRDATEPPLDPASSAVCMNLTDLLIGMQWRKDAWDQGSFSVPDWDDDFVGSFDKENPERGPRPTVDATGGCIIALCAAARAKLANVTSGTTRDFATQARESIGAGVQFLLRSQFAAGGWPIHRYERDIYELPARDISSRYAVEALADAVRGNFIDQSLAAAAGAAVARYIDFALSVVRKNDTELFWLPNYVKEDAQERQRIQATCTVWLSVEAGVRAWPELQPKVTPIRRKVASFLERAWKPNPEGFVSIEFRAPRWNGPADTFSYEWPADPIIVSCLLTAASAGCLTLQPGTTEHIARAVSHFLTLQRHGHWDDFLMAKKGAQRGVPPNTLQYHRALFDFLHWQAETLTNFFRKNNGPSGSTAKRRIATPPRSIERSNATGDVG